MVQIVFLPRTQGRIKEGVERSQRLNDLNGLNLRELWNPKLKIRRLKLSTA